MDKVTLIMDKPKNCYYCPINEIICGVFSHPGDDTDYYNQKPDDCLLIPEPERMTEREVVEIENVATCTYKNIYAKGWNACLDTLEGKENE